MDELLRWVFVAGVCAGVLFCIFIHWFMECLAFGLVYWAGSRPPKRSTPSGGAAE